MGLIIERPQPCVEGSQVALNVCLTTLEEDFVQTELFEIYIKSANTGTKYTHDKIQADWVARNTREGQLLFSFPQGIGIFGTYYIIEVIRLNTRSIGTTSVVYTSNPGLVMPDDLQQQKNLEKQLITFTYDPRGDSTARLIKYEINIYKNEQLWESSGLQITNSNTVEYNFEKVWQQEAQTITYSVEIVTWSNYGLVWSIKPPSLSKDFSSMKKIEGSANYASTLLLNVQPQVQIDEEYGHAAVTMPLTMRIYGSEIYYSDNYLQLMVDKNVGYGIDRRLLQYSNLNKLIKVYGDVFGNSLLSIGANVFDITNKYLFLIPFPAGAKMPTNFCIDVPYSAHFYLYRQQDNGLYYKVYDELGKAVEPIVCHEVDDNGNVTNLFRYEDYAVEHGSEYNYAISQYKVNNDTETVPVGLAETHAIGLLDNIILSDATRELKIKFNPKISSFKTTIQEQKIDTIGGKYPFFFRNGDVNYKEMSLEGLISYTADDQMHFMQDDSFLRIEDEFYRERIYKREVEDWLNNGQPKLLRTAAEGSFLVRLMNVSLTPIDTLGRRLHSFSATAYEVGPVSDSVLKQYGLNGKFTPAEFNPEAYAPYPGDSTSDYRWIKVGKLPKGLRSSDKDVLINFKEYQKILPIDRILFKNVRRNAGIAYNGKKLLYGDKTSEEQVLISGYEGYYCKWLGEASANIFEITNDTVDDYNIEVYIGYPAPKRIALEEVE